MTEPTPIHRPQTREGLWWHLDHREETHDGETHTEFQLHDEQCTCHAHFHEYHLAQFVITFLNSSLALDRPGLLDAHQCTRCQAAPALTGYVCGPCYRVLLTTEGS